MTHLEVTGSSGREMILAEGAAMDEDEPGELVEGRLVEEEMPGFVHELCVTWPIRIGGSWLASRGGFIGGSEAKFAVGRRRGRKPDVSIYLPGVMAEVPGCSGLSLDLDALWHELDRLSPPQAEGQERE
jgi:hypothetical protein